MEEEPGTTGRDGVTGKEVLGGASGLTLLSWTVKLEDHSAFWRGGGASVEGVEGLREDRGRRTG